MCKILNSKYNSFIKKIDEEKEKTGENNADFKLREKELKENLETMTQIAQRIDNENVSLMKKNAELSIEFKSQAKDKDLLIKQIIKQKKINQENIAKLAKMKQVAEELEKKMKEEQINKNTMDDEYSKRGKVEDRGSMTEVKRKKLKSSLGKDKQIRGSRIIMSQSKKSLHAGDFEPQVINLKSGADFHKSNERILSANVVGNPKLRRYEQIIKKLKKIIENETRKLRDIKTVYSREIESKTQLEQLLRQCVDDVKIEISKKRSENKVLYYNNKKGTSSTGKLKKSELSQNEREKVVEVLLSQERVLTLLYDKTFPPKLSDNNQAN